MALSFKGSSKQSNLLWSNMTSKSINRTFELILEEQIPTKNPNRDFELVLVEHIPTYKVLIELSNLI